MLAFQLQKRYGDFRLELSAAVKDQWLALLAPSGSGKTLSLNLIAGLDRPARGYLTLGTRTLFSSARGVNIPMRQRRIGYVFQEGALFPHLSVAENITYGLPRSKRTQAEVQRWLDFFQLQRSYARRRPGQLSGGERQRVAIARALACQPDLLLLDEPFSSLDRSVRHHLQQAVLALKAELSIPVVLVTHDFDEALLLSEQLVVLEQGQVLESGPTRQLLARPTQERTARFLGVENLWEAELQLHANGMATAHVAGMVLQLDDAHAQVGASSGGQGRCIVGIRAEDVTLGGTAQPLDALAREEHGETAGLAVNRAAGSAAGSAVNGAVNSASAWVRAIRRETRMCVLHLDLIGAANQSLPLVIRLPDAQLRGVRVGDQVSVGFSAAHLFCCAADASTADVSTADASTADASMPAC